MDGEKEISKSIYHINNIVNIANMRNMSLITVSAWRTLPIQQVACLGWRYINQMAEWVSVSKTNCNASQKNTMS